MSDRSLWYKRIRRQSRVRYKLQKFNTRNLYRLSVFKSNSHVYAQIIDDNQQKTLVHLSTVCKEWKKKFPEVNQSKVKNFSNQTYATKLGEMIASRAKKEGITEVIFDRGRYLYHGVIKALGDSARTNGLKF